jgi:DNA (cytosine-5)-methyltransferase 1
MSHVDTTKTTSHIGLCAGYGGIELGLKRVIPNLRSIALCEIEAFACANLVAKMEAGLLDPAPIWTNVKTFPWGAFRDRVDVLTGGYPCQPFSSAGLRRGKDDPRHLWPWIADGIQLMRPRLCFFENVEGHISMGLSDVIEDLVGMGYRVAWGIFSAAECLDINGRKAPHQRKRVFILADSKLSIATRFGQHGWKPSLLQKAVRFNCGSQGQQWPARPGQQQHAWEPPRVVANTKSERVGQRSKLCSEECGSRSALPRDVEQSDPNMGNAASEGPQERPPRCVDSPIQAAQCGSGSEGDRETQSSLGGNADGVAGGVDYAELCVTCDNRADELRLLGNGVVPATAEKAFRVLLQKLS